MDWSKPALADNYTAWPTSIQQNVADLAKMLDGVTHTGTIPTGAVRWSSGNFRFEKWSGTAWAALVDIASAAYAIRVDTADKLNGQLASYYLDVGNVAAGTLSAARGGTGIASYAVGDLLYASGASALSKLAGVATGNVLLSGGVGVAPAYGKVSLTVHVSGVLPAANGGTGISSFTAGNYINALNSNTLQQRTPAQVKTDLALVKGDVGLGNVDNTSDANKPVSTAQQTAIDLAKDIPQVVQNASATFAITDRGKHWIKTDTSAYNWTIPLNSAVAFPIGAAISGRVKSGTGAITINKTAGVVLRKAGTGTDLATVTASPWSQFTLVKEGTDEWVISGTGI